jgi:trehalose utilization protein
MKHVPAPLGFIAKIFMRLACLAIAAAFMAVAMSAAAAPIRVLVWDEREAAQKQAYDGFLGDTVAAYLAKQPGLTVKSVGLDDPDQGLSDEALDNCDVLIWWGHERHGDVTDAHVNAILERLKKGRLGLVALHSAHWSKPFIAAMDTRAVDDALQSVPKSERSKIKIVKIPAKRGLTGPNDPVTPSFKRFTADDGTDTLEVHLPACVFSVVKAEGKPSHIMTMLPKHPIAKGIPATFDIPQTEIYSGTFSVPKPDAMIFEEKWDEGGYTFTSGCAWKVEKGRVFYFRPGHEIYPIYKQEYPLKIVENAVRWVRGSK